MSWTRLDADMRDHPKWLALSPLAYRLGVRLVLWANQHAPTTAFVPAFVVKEYAGTPTMARKLSRELVECGKPFGKSGILESAESGFVIHDLLTAPRLATSEQKSGPMSKSEAGRRGGVASAEARASASGSARPGASAVLRRSNPEAAQDPTYQDDSGSPDPDQNPTKAYDDSQDLPGSASEALAKQSSSFDSGSESDSETVCPLNLLERARRFGVFSQMLERMPGVELIQLEEKAKSFVNYWTIGGGTGQRRRHWMRKLREDLRQAYEQNKLPAVGLVEHQDRLELERGATDEQRERWAARRLELDQQEAERGTA